MVMRLVMALLCLLLLMPFLRWAERWAMGEWWRYMLVAALSGAAWLEVRRRGKANERDEEGLSFEERAPSEFELLKLA
jgi:hypothetical protein